MTRLPRRSDTPAKPALPALAFGDRNAVVKTNARAYAAQMATVVTSLPAYDQVGGANGFASKSCTLEFNGVKLVAEANTPIAIDVGDTTDITLMIPFYGINVTTVGQERFNWNAGLGALFTPGTAHSCVCSTRSTLNVVLDHLRLQATAQAMLGKTANELIDLHADHTRAVPFKSHGLALEGVFHHVCTLIETVKCDTKMLALLGVDDLLYRNIVLMLRPDLFAAQAAAPDVLGAATRPRRALDPLCDYLVANLSERITLSDMERISNMSERGLQYAFLQRFGNTPLQWLRGARLDRARQELARSDQSRNITDLALAHGFSKPSDFASHYRRRFGELPSETRAQLQEDGASPD